MHREAKNQRKLILFLIIVLIISIFFRFINLDKKVYWHDEVYTSLRISGYSAGECQEQLIGQVVNIEDLQKCQQVNSEKDLTDTIISLAKAEPQLAPLHYVILRFWQEKLGDSVAVRRSLSAFISLLAFPSIYWLCLELFNSSLTGWIAMALIAVSPFHIIYAQEVRMYSLWTVTILLSSAALLRLMRKTTKLSWVIYTACLSLGLYTHTLSFLIILGHGIYIIANQGIRFSKIFMAYLLASLIAIISFSPWITIILNGWESTNTVRGWTAVPISIFPLIKIWILNLTRIFLDIEFSFKNPLTYLILPIIILVIYAIFFLIYKTKKQIWLFILILILVTGLVMILPDLFLGGRRSTVAQYLTPCYLGIQLAIAYLFNTKIAPISDSANRRQAKLWRNLMIVVISCGVISGIINFQLESKFNASFNKSNPQIAFIINQAEAPLLISEDWVNLVSVSYNLVPKTKVKLIDKNQKKLQLDNNFSDIFLLNPSPQNLKTIRKDINIYSVYTAHRMSLWQLEE